MLSTSSRLTTLASSRASSLLTTRITTSSTRSISSLARRASPSTRSCIPLCRSFSSTPSHLDATFDHPHNQRLHHSEASSEPSSTSSSSAVAQAPTTSAQVPGPILGGEGKHFEDSRAVRSPGSPIIQPATTAASESQLGSGVAQQQQQMLYDLAQPHNFAWTMSHPVYTEAQLDAVQVVYAPRESRSDRIVAGFVRFCRKSFDFFSGYRHVPLPANHGSMTVAELRKMGCYMDNHQWLRRILFLETTAAIPGMVAGAVRHLHSLRLMRRDGGFIHQLLQEAENERMHLLTFLSLVKNPSVPFRALVLVSQGVFYNLFFLSYLFAPQLAHRFVACLEEEAVLTYTRVIEDIEAGRLPEWSNQPAPDIAKSYWRLPEKATLLDTIRAVRADESTHRFVNSTLAGLDLKADFNPFAICEPDAVIKGQSAGFTREEAAKWAAEARDKVAQGQSLPSGH